MCFIVTQCSKHIKAYEPNCISAVCSKGCLHGTCVAPDECICNQGWSGESCDQCIQLPGCNHGYCNNTANDCICHRGWKGRLCDEPICLPGCNLDHAKCSNVIISTCTYHTTYVLQNSCMKLMLSIYRAPES